MSDEGVNFPGRSRGRSSTQMGKQVLRAAVSGFAPDLAARVAAEGEWRTGYPRHFEALTALEARSGETALAVARAGLAEATASFVDVAGETDHPLEHALERRETTLTTVELAGEGVRRTRLEVPYAGELLSGDTLLRQLDDWVDRGITEPSFGEAVGAVVRHPEWLDLSDRTFAVVGAGAAMGPYADLLGWGARVAALDLPRPQVWERLVQTARSSAGRLLVPVRDGDGAAGEVVVQRAGADLLTETGAVTEWLSDLPGPLTVGNYGYADGALFVRLTMAFDAVLTNLASRRGDLSVAYLATPSDVFLVPYDAVRESRRRQHELRPLVLAARGVNRATSGRLLRPNYTDAAVLDTEAGRFGLVNAMIVEQGQNYALAKRLQRWRMMVTRADGLLTSVHVAPPTRTASVHSNPVMEERQRLTARLGIETFDADTSRALAAAVLVHDVRDPASAANPAVPLRHPHESFMRAANPGGRWRVPLEPGSALPVLQRLVKVPGLPASPVRHDRYDRHSPR